MRLICVVVLLCGMLSGQILYEEHFTDGNMQLDWKPWFTDTLDLGDSMQVLSDPTAPGGDSWAGRISNEYMGVSGLTYAGTADMDDYSIEAWIYTIVVPAMGPYNGIAMRCDPNTGWYYRFVSDFDSDHRLRLAAFTGGMGAAIIHDWTSGEIPGGAPSSSSWHKFKLKMIADSIWAYYDDVLLPDCPLINDTIAAGHFGVYVFNMSDTTSTRCDDIIVQAEGTGVAEYGASPAVLLTAYPNPFTNTTNIGYTIHDTGYMTENSCLRIYDTSGRLVRFFDHASCIVDHGSSVVWDGRDAGGSVVAPGVYFVTDAWGGIAKVIKTE